MSLVAPGRCRYCDCTDGAPCAYCKAFHDECVLSADLLVCSQPSCIRQEQERLRRAREEARAERAALNRLYEPGEFKGWGKGAVRLELRKRARALRRKGARQ